MSIFIKTLNNLLSGNLDKIGKNLVLESDFTLNTNNYSLMFENNSILEFNYLATDTSSTGILYNIKQLEAADDVKNYFYSCLTLGLNDMQIVNLARIEEFLFANASEKSTSKLVNMNEFIISKFFIENNKTDFKDISEIREFVINNVLSYVGVLNEICMDDRALYKYVPFIYSLKKELCTYS